MSTNKRRYRIRNWGAYNRALIERGSLTVWLDEEALTPWYAQRKTGRRGASPTYSAVAIQTTLMIREVFQLPLRATQGLMHSLLRLLAVELRVPNFSTLSRRGGTLTVAIGRRAAPDARDVVIDATGLKVYGEGEWQVRRHGAGKRRVWRKLHLAVDPTYQQSIAARLTTQHVGDNEVLPELLEQLDPTPECPEAPIGSVAGDGAFDTRDCHDAILTRGARALIPPRDGAVPWPPRPDGQPHPRTEIVEHCRRHGRPHWKRHSGYHRRSRAETEMFRYKTLFSDRLKNRRFDTQVTEAYVRLAALNIMTGLGMPESYPVPAA